MCSLEQERRLLLSRHERMPETAYSALLDILPPVGVDELLPHAAPTAL